jgi:multiple sugar transport system ATP-binding protein
MLGFRPEHAAMVAPGTSDSLEGEVYVVEPLGNETLITVALGDDLINLRAAAGADPAIGSRIGLLPERSHLHLFDSETGAAIPEAPSDKEESASYTPPTIPPTSPSHPATEGALHERQHEQ